MTEHPTPLDRRDFLAGLLGLGALAVRPSPDEAVPHVDALPTVFFSAPDARTALVRFVVDGSDAPGGRLRVYDQARRQVGTAGVIGMGGRLYGELWLPLERETSFSTDLELPGVRGVIRSYHRILPRQRWTLHVITLATLPPLEGAEYFDHAAFLAAGAPIRDVNAAAVPEPTGSGATLSSVPLLLAGRGVRWVIRRDASQGAPVQLRARDGSTVTVVPVAPGGTPDELGFFSGGEDMRRRVERWIESSASLQSAGPWRPDAVVLSTSPDDVSRSGAQIEEWTARFAYPRIVVGKWDDYAATVAPAAVTAARGVVARPVSTGARRAELAAARDAERRARVDRLVAPLLARLPSAAPGLAAVAAQFAFRVPTTLVFNPSPFTRSDVATMPDGTERVVADVPGHGYLCVPDARGQTGAGGEGRWVRGGDELVLRNQSLTLRVDPASGAIQSVRGATEREWVGSRGSGWNGLEGFRLAQVTPERNSLVGQRLTLERTGPNRARLITTVTVYDRLPWIDVRNELTGGDTEGPVYLFPFAVPQPRASWEIPAGFETSNSAIEGLAHLRWIKLESGDDVVLFRGLDAPDAAIDQDSVLTSFAPASVSRYRIGMASRFSLADDAWRFGWSTEQFLTVSVPGTGRATLASYGSMIIVDQSGIAVLDCRPARDNSDVIVLLQELLGTTRDITLGPGLLTFSGGRRVDFLERDLGPLPDLGGRGVALPIAGYGITAVRLTGVGLAGG